VYADTRVIQQTGRDNPLRYSDERSSE